MKKRNKAENYFKGLKDGVSIGIAYVPFGITIGLIARDFGMKLLTAAIMSFGLYSGSGETTFLKMTYELNSGYMEIIISIFLINLRYALMNMIMFRKIINATLFERIFMGIGLTDETIAYLTIRKAESVWYAIGVNTMPYILFGMGTVFGSAFGNIIPSAFSKSLNFMLYATFLSLLVSSLKISLKYAEVVIMAVILKLIFMYVPILKGISTGWSLIMIMVVASALYALRHYKEKDEEMEGIEIEG